jgi:competence protein ComEC
MRKSLIIKYLLVLFIIGVLVRSLFSWPLLIPLIFGLVGTVLAIVFYENQKKIAILLLGSIFLFLGFWRVESFLPKVDESHVLNFNGQVVQFSGTISQEPDKRDNSIHYQVDIDAIEGDVLVFGSKYSDYKLGDKLAIQCRLEQPEILDNFNYPGFLAKDGIYSLCFNPQSIERIENSHPELVSASTLRQAQGDNGSRNKFGMTTLNVKSWLIDQKQNFKSIIDSSVNFPASTFLNSILLGLRREVPQKIQDNFSVTGTSHLMAISGLHIVILSGIIFSLFRGLRISKKQAFLFVIIFLVFFVALIGFRSSAIRASVFGLVGILAQVVARPKRATLVLLWAAVILLLTNPLLLVHDIGFQLSFLAVLGLIYLGEWFKRVFRKIPKDLGLRDTLVMTMSAQIFVLPWILYKFGTLSIISPLANLLVLPVMPLVMGLGFALIVLGLIWLPFAQIIGWALWGLISYILLVVNLLAQVPLGNLQTSLPLWGAVVIYMIYALFIYQPSRQIILNKLNINKKPKEKVLTKDNTETVTEVVDLGEYEKTRHE